MVAPKYFFYCKFTWRRLRRLYLGSRYFFAEDCWTSSAAILLFTLPAGWCYFAIFYFNEKIKLKNKQGTSLLSNTVYFINTSVVQTQKGSLHQALVCFTACTRTEWVFSYSKLDTHKARVTHVGHKCKCKVSRDKKAAPTSCVQMLRGARLAALLPLRPAPPPLFPPMTQRCCAHLNKCVSAETSGAGETTHSVCKYAVTKKWVNTEKLKLIEATLAFWNTIDGFIINLSQIRSKDDEFSKDEWQRSYKRRFVLCSHSAGERHLQYQRRECTIKNPFEVRSIIKPQTWTSGSLWNHGRA